MRGIAYDTVSGNLIFCDTHSGSGGQSTNFPWSAIYVLDGDTGDIKAVLNTNGITGGSYTFVVPGASDDGVIYVCNQTTASQNNAFKIYRWSTADTNNSSFGQPPVVAYSGYISNNIGTSGDRLGETMDVRGSGPNTQIMFGSSSLNGTGTNLFLFTTPDGTNFFPTRISFTNVIATAVFNDGIAFGPGNTVFCKQVGKPLYYITWDTNALVTPGSQFSGTNQIAGTVISAFSASSVNDPLLNLSAIAYDPVNKLLAGMEQIGGTATGGRGKIWLYDEADPSNRAPAVLSSRIYTPNFQKTTAPMGYLRFRSGNRLYGHASNNGFLCSTVDSVTLNPPTFSPDLPASTRVAVGQNVHFEVFAVADVTNYQWFSNNVLIAGVKTYYYDIPNVNSGMSGVFKVVSYNAAGSATSANSTLTVVSASQFFHPDLLWSVAGNSLALNNPTNFITQNGGSGTPNERTIAFNALSNQLLVVRGPAALGNLKIMVLDADRGTNGYLYTLKTNGMTPGQNLTLCGVGVADDGAVYAAVAGSDTSFKVYRWADTGSNTVPITIFGTNSATTNYTGVPYNPISDLTGGTTFRFGDALAVRGSGINTEILLDGGNNTTYASIITPKDTGMTNWGQSGFVMQNKVGSYGSSAYGTTIGRGLQFGTGNTIWQKRYNGAAGAPLALMNYNPGGGLAILNTANTSPGLFTNGPVGVNPTLNVAAGINFVGGLGTDSGALQDTLSYYDLTDPSQAVLLSTQPLPQGNAGFHKGNANAIGQVIFGQNSTTGTNYMFVIDANNGVAAFVLSGGVIPPPKILAQPHNLRVLQGSSGSMFVTVDQIANLKWYKGTNSPVDTGVSGQTYNIASAVQADAGDYFLIASNANGVVTSAVAHVTVSLPDDNYTLATVWSLGGGSAPFITANGGPNTPTEREFAYNAPSNQLIIVSCPPASGAWNLYVVNATTGALIGTLNTNGGAIFREGTSEVSGSNPIDLVGAAATDDGNIYVCNESPNASGGSAQDPSKMFHVYRWTNSGPSTTPVMVYQGDPSFQPAGINERWGDSMTVRGTGMNTEIYLNTQSGSFGAVLKPVDASLNSFTNYWFNGSGGGGSIGRSIQFGPTNSVYEKRKGTALVWSSYDTNVNVNSSGVIMQIDSSASLGGVALDSAHNLAIGVDFVGSPSATPDAVALYDLTDPSSPMLINRYNFSINQVANANVICETIVAGNRAWALDANNGLMFLTIVPPANSMKLSIAPQGSNVKLSWGNSQAILQSSPSLSPQVWTDIAGPGVTNSVQPAASGAIYRLIQRL
jgi:hypothetical protein